MRTEKPLTRINWAEIKGTHYKVNSILTKDLNDDKPNFVMIKNIFLYGSHGIIFEFCLLSIVNFYEHVYAYEVEILRIK